MALTPQQIADLEAAAAMMQGRYQSGLGSLQAGTLSELDPLYNYAKTAPVLSLKGNKEYENLNFQPLPGQTYRLMVNGQEAGRGNTPEGVASLVSAANLASEQGGKKVDVRLQKEVSAMVEGQPKTVFADTYVNGANNNGFLDIAIPAALAVMGAVYLGPLIAPKAIAATATTAATVKATALGLAVGAGAGSAAGNLLVGQPLDESLLRGLTTAATAYGGAGLGPVIGGGSFGVGAGAGAANFAANIARGMSVEDALKSAGIAGVTAGTMDALLGGGGTKSTSKNSDIATGIPGTKLDALGRIVDATTGDLLSAADIAAAKIGSTAAQAGATGVGSTVNNAADIIVSNTATGGIGTLGSTFGAGAANLNLPNFGNVDISNVRVPTNDEVSGTYRDLDGNIRDNTTNDIIVSSTTGGIGTLGSSLGAGTANLVLPPPAPPSPPPVPPSADDKQIDVEADKNRPPAPPSPPPAPPSPPPAPPPADDKPKDDDLIIVKSDKYPFTLGTGLISEPLFPSSGTTTTPPKTTKQKVLSALKTVSGLTPLIGLLAEAVGGGGGGGGTVDVGTGYTVPTGRRTLGTFNDNPFTYGQRSGELRFFNNDMAGTTTGIGGGATTGSATGATAGTGGGATRTAGTPGPAATAAEIQAAFPGYTNIRQDAQGRWFGEPIPDYTASEAPTTNLRVTAGGTFNPTIEDYRAFNPGFENVEQDAAGQYMGVNFEDVPGTPTSTPRTYTVDEIRGLFPNYNSYEQGDDGQWYGIKSESVPAPSTVNDGPAMAEGGEVDDDMVKHLIEYRKGGGHMGPGQVKGIGSGQDDKIPAWLSDGEYVWSAQDVADLGDGSTDEGVRRLDKMRQMVRKGAGRKDVKKIAKPQRGIEDMLKAVGGAV